MTREAFLTALTAQLPLYLRLYDLTVEERAELDTMAQAAVEHLEGALGHAPDYSSARVMYLAKCVAHDLYETRSEETEIGSVYRAKGTNRRRLVESMLLQLKLGAPP